MGKINLSDLQAGMTVASDVTNINGQLLLPTGLKLTERHLSMLEAWGITEVDVQGVTREEVATKSVEQLDPQVLAEVEKELAEVFRHTDRTHPLISELFRLCVIRKAQRL